MKALTGMSPSEFNILLITFEKILLNIVLSKKRLRAVGGVLGLACLKAALG